MFALVHVDVAKKVSTLSGLSSFTPSFWSLFSRYILDLMVWSASPSFFILHANDTKETCCPREFDVVRGDNLPELRLCQL